MSTLTRSPAWQALGAHRERMAAASIAGLFASDESRAGRFSLAVGNLLFDYSKHLVDPEALRLLLALAAQAGVAERTAAMFAGDPINNTEARAVLHVALRADSPAFPEGRDVMPEVRLARMRMRSLAQAAERRTLLGATSRPITDVVNIGIGGSDLGPRMVVRALQGTERRAGLRAHFVANIDPSDLDVALAGLDPTTTFFVVASKTFTTTETLDNARRALVWLRSGLGEAAAMSHHWAAVTANPAAAAQWGVVPERIFPMWDWVGGRYSVWSAVGLTAALALGADAFDELLEGARAMDEHFSRAPLERNAPVILALLDIWYVNFFGARSHAVIPYSEALREFPGYLQQLEMESNGKRVDREGRIVDYATAPVVWGSTGTPSQHSFHQLLHQGTNLIPVDFIVFARGNGEDSASVALATNALAQSAALAFGNPQPGALHRELPGNRPSSMLLFDRLTPRALGALIALYEHKVFVQGIIWNVNSFDQWGVEHGKNVARALLQGESAALDGSTRALLRRINRTD